jgi:hypothetical protein
MPDHVTEALFSLFTSSDQAEAITGDLMEERERRGWIWFWLHVGRVALTLCRNAAAEAPLQVLALTAAGCALFIAPAFGGLAAVYLFPWSWPAVNWIALSCFWWGGALWIGAWLVRIAPRRGMAACTTLAVASEALLIGVAMTAVGRDVMSGGALRFYMIGLLAAAPLLAGGAIARRRMIAR